MTILQSCIHFQKKEAACTARLQLMKSREAAEVYETVEVPWKFVRKCFNLAMKDMSFFFSKDGPYPTSFFFIFVFSKLQLVEYWSLMSMMGFILQTSGAGSDR